jgi:hypothetical protein
MKNLLYNLIDKEITSEDIDINLLKEFDTTFFDTEKFHFYHQKNVDEVYRFIVLNKNKPIALSYIGRTGNVLKAPYSSPFSNIYLYKKYRISDVMKISKGLIRVVEHLNCNKIQITLPPEMYSEQTISVFQAALASVGFKVNKIDINNFYDLTTFNSLESYLKKLSRMPRRNYNIAIKNNFSFTELPLSNFQLAYDVIKVNREEMGYPLRIGVTQMNDLLSILPSNGKCFVINNDEKIPIAAAIVFDVTKDISQVIYWGDKPKYRDLKPMSLLTTHLFEYYAKAKKMCLDIGPSSENGIINQGLADFKKMIGCKNNIKLTFEYNN